MFRRPSEGQSLISYLSEQDFGSCADLEKVRSLRGYQRVHELGDRSRLGDDAGLNPRAVNPTSACPDLAPVGGVWGSQAFQRRAYKLKATCCFGITKKKQEGKALGAGFLED